jgi:uncharacterized protein YbaA (DUF1428 family)
LAAEVSWAARHCRPKPPSLSARGATSFPVIPPFGSLDAPDGKLTSFPVAVKIEEGETVVFSWIVWRSKTARDAGNAEAIADPRMQAPDPVPFSMPRIIYGGFQPTVEA